MMRRLLLLFSVVLVAFCLGTSLAEKEETGIISGEFEYVVLVDNSAKVLKYTGESEYLVIPEEIDGHMLSCLSDASFAGRTDLKVVEIPSCIKQIEGNPFVSCFKLEEIKISPKHETLAIIEKALYYKPEKRLVCCPAAYSTEIFEVPSGIKAINEHAFYGCQYIASIIIPDTVEEIGNGAFNNCSLLKSIHIPDSVKSIGTGVFVFCTRMEDITLPHSLHEIPVSSFRFCKALKSISLPDELVAVNEYAFDGCESLEEVKIPEGVTKIGARAFSGCNNMKSITLPECVAEIGELAFPILNFDLVVTVAEGSFAEKYCEENRLQYKYVNSDDWLNN